MAQDRSPHPSPPGERGKGGGERELPVKATRDQEVTLRVESRGLPAGRTYSGKLTVVTNGGVAEAPVRLDLTAVPFLKPPFAGAVTARELAERMRAHPKPAGPLLESGDVARWFEANGWSYPVAGTRRTAWPRCSSSSSAWACQNRRRWNCRSRSFFSNARRRKSRTVK